MLQSVNLRDYMLPNPVKVKPDDSVLDAMRSSSTTRYPVSV